MRHIGLANGRSVMMTCVSLVENQILTEMFCFHFQVTCSQPTNDLALLIISSLTSKTRRENAGKLLECYWENFVENLKRLNVDANRDLNYGLGDLFADYKRSQLLALLLCIGSIDVALKDSDIEERLIDVLIDLHKDGILSPEFVNNL